MQFKLVLLGESGVGKSSLAVRFAKGRFHEHHDLTVGTAFLTKTLNLHDTTFKLEIWDTAGQELYRSVAPMYYRKAKAAIVVYDITKRATFERAKKWVLEVREKEQSALIVLVGNKGDLKQHQMVESREAATYTEENGLLFMETSAKTGENVEEMFLALSKKLTDDQENDYGPNGIWLGHDGVVKKCCI